MSLMGALKQWSNLFCSCTPLGKNIFEHASSMFNLKTNKKKCTTVLAYYVHHKTYTKTEMKKECDKNEINTVLRKVLFISGTKSIFFLRAWWVG